MEVTKYHLGLQLQFELDENQIKELISINNNKCQNKNYLKEVTSDLLKLEELCLVYRGINESSRQDYWFITFIGEKLFNNMVIQSIMKELQNDRSSNTNHL